jgi:valyl-tRNA synthetase
VRPLTRVADRAALDAAPAGALGIVAGEIDARLHADAARGDADRGRIEKELAQATAALEATRTRLADPTFLDRAPAAIVDGARAREAELAERVRRLEESVR